MEAAQTGSPPPRTDEEVTKPSDALPGGAPDGLVEAADTTPGKRPFEEDEPEEAGEKESEALDFLLGNPHALRYDVEVEYDIPGGRRVPLVFVIKQLDGKRIIDIEDEHRIGGRGPFSELDNVATDAHLVAEATEKIVDKKAGKEVETDSMEFIGAGVTPQDAMRSRFAFQSGLLAGVAAHVRTISGYSPGRVGDPQRPIRQAVSG